MGGGLFVNLLLKNRARGILGIHKTILVYLKILKYTLLFQFDVLPENHYYEEERTCCHYLS